jgi:hypothetical protein
LANFHEILDFAILNLILTITDSRLLISLKRLCVSHTAGCRVPDTTPAPENNMPREHKKRIIFGGPWRTVISNHKCSTQVPVSKITGTGTERCAYGTWCRRVGLQVIEVSMVRMMKVVKVNPQADSVPRGMDLAGRSSSPDKFAPAIMP